MSKIEPIFKITLPLCISAIVLTSCATTANYEKKLNSWVGSSELNLVQSWGPPVQSYEAGGHRFLVYSSSRNIFLPGTAPQYRTTFVGNTAYTNQVGGTAAQSIDLGCQTTFELSDGRIRSWRWQGNDCKAPE